MYFENQNIEPFLVFDFETEVPLPENGRETSWIWFSSEEFEIQGR